METKFELHARLAASGIVLGECGDVLVLLKNNALFPWIILVPMVANVTDLHELTGEIYQQTVGLLREISLWLQSRTGAPKLNVAAIGNAVPQLHVHVVARFFDDAAWPNPAWVHDGKTPYSEQDIVSWKSDFAKKFLPNA